MQGVQDLLDRMMQHKKDASTYDEGAISEIREENVRQVDSPCAGIVCTLLNTVGQQQRVLHYEGTDDKQDASLELMPSSFDMSMANSVCQGCYEEDDPYDHYRNQVLNIQQKVDHCTSVLCCRDPVCL